MKKFGLEERYIVAKKKRLSEEQVAVIDAVVSVFDAEETDCLVIESDWPEYEVVLEMLRKRVEWETADKARPDINCRLCYGSGFLYDDKDLGECGCVVGTKVPPTDKVQVDRSELMALLEAVMESGVDFNQHRNAYDRTQQMLRKFGSR